MDKTMLATSYSDGETQKGKRVKPIKAEVKNSLFSLKKEKFSIEPKMNSRLFDSMEILKVN